MVDKEQLVDVKITKINKKEYIKRGYATEETEYESIVKVPLYDVYKGSKLYIEAVCDNPECGKHYKILIGNYNKILEQEDIRNFCKDCASIKQKEVLIKKYGVDNPFKIEEVKEKIKNTNLEKYGVEHIAQSKEFQEKRFKTNLEKYGCITPLGNKEVIKKGKETLKEHYGVDNPSQSDEIQTKIRESYYEKGNYKISSQQLVINEYLKGELNYPFKRYSLDIAFPNEKIDVEYNGGGHNLQVKLGTITESKFIQNETYRKKQLYSENWKIITFISPSNKVLTKEETINSFKSAKNYFIQEQRHWVEIYIEEKKIKTSQFEMDLENFIKKYL